MRSFWFAALLGATAFFSLGCKHTVEIASTPPGAIVSQNGVALGRTPLMYDAKLGPKETVRMTLEKDGVERELVFEREQFQFAGTGVGALIGVGACCAFGSVIGVASTVFAPLGVLGLLGLTFPFAGGIVGYLLYGFSPPDVIDVNLTNGDITTNPPTNAQLGEAVGVPTSSEPSDEDGTSEDVEVGTSEDAGTESGVSGDAPPRPAVETPSPRPEESSDDDEYGKRPLDLDEGSEYGAPDEGSPDERQRF